VAGRQSDRQGCGRRRSDTIGLRNALLLKGGGSLRTKEIGFWLHGDMPPVRDRRSEFLPATISLCFLLRGFGLGFAIATPVGPVGILVIRRTLSDGRHVGFVSGLGAATADAVYGSIAAFGLTFISSALIGESAWIRLVGGAVLCYLGLTLIVSRPANAATSAEGRAGLGAYASVTFLTLTNPATILSFAGAFAAFGLTNPHGNYAAAAMLVVGVFLGSAIWWALLTGLVSLFRAPRRPSTGLGESSVRRVPGRLWTGLCGQRAWLRPQGPPGRLIHAFAGRTNEAARVERETRSVIGQVEAIEPSFCDPWHEWKPDPS